IFTGTEALHQPDGSDSSPEVVGLTEAQRQRVSTLRKDAYMNDICQNKCMPPTAFRQKQIRSSANGPKGPPRRIGRPLKTPEQRAADKTARQAAKSVELARLAEKSLGSSRRPNVKTVHPLSEAQLPPTATSGARFDTPDLSVVARHARDLFPPRGQSLPPQTAIAAPILPEPSQTITLAIQTQSPISVPSHPASSITNASPQSLMQSTKTSGSVSITSSPAQETNDPAIVPPTAAPGSAIRGSVGNETAVGFALPFFQAQPSTWPPPPQRENFFIFWCEIAIFFRRAQPPTALVDLYSTRNLALSTAAASFDSSFSMASAGSLSPTSG
ncbi:hypothetical protein PpBr36_08883, partial [Pyricularia pennisetigena]|uniref:hypothetical protein n=1 Tax=Pyricularia pennisetigena TaxID=1578925 RepID=UPI0011506589